MLEIKAKENATIDVIKGTFALGDRNTIKIDIDDDVIKQYLKAVGTDTCIPENNLYTYGNFDYPEDVMSKLKLALNSKSKVEVVDGYGINCSRCLHCVSGSYQGLGLCELPSDSYITKDEKYKLSCKFLISEGTDAYINGQQLVTTKYNEWQDFVFEFNATVGETYYYLPIQIVGEGEIYIDNLMLFKSEDEVKENQFDNVEFCVSICNPKQDIIINEVVNYTDNSIIMYVPPITVVDFQDNLLCKLSINLYQEQKDKYLGDIKYNKIKECVYNSEPFILTGYILPPESDRYELSVGQV